MSQRKLKTLLLKNNQKQPIKISKLTALILISLVMMLSLVLLSGILGTSNNPCSSCHGSYSQRVNLLPTDSSTSLPAEFVVNSDADVKIAVEVVASGNVGSYPEYYKIDVLKVTLSSNSNKVSIQNAEQILINKNPGDKVTFQWIVSGLYTGQDTLTFSLWANNSHAGTEAPLIFTDSYYYQVVVNDKPSPPQNLIAITGNEFVELSWEEPYNDGGANIIGYDIHRGTTSGIQPKPLIDSVDGATFNYNDTSVTNDQIYYYYLVAKNTVGNSNPSPEVSAKPELITTIPSPPINLSAIPGNGFVELSWEEPASKGGLTITGYIIYGGTNSNSKSEAGSVGAAGKNFKDKSVINGMTYYYHVTAVNPNGESNPAMK